MPTRGLSAGRITYDIVAIGDLKWGNRVMKCWVERRYFISARACIEAPPKAEARSETPPNPAPDKTMIRLQAENDTLRVRSPHGEADVPCRIEVSGVAFLPLDPFLDATTDIAEGKWVPIDASIKGVHVTGRSLYLQPGEFVVFDDPGTAPDWWKPNPSK